MTSIFEKTRFVLSAPTLHELPYHEVEIAFMGRSNVGKSSTLNALCRQKKLAKTSKTPGRTQAINVFELNDQAVLLDFPGLGFAKVPPSLTKQWLKMIAYYLEAREPLALLVIIMDIRHPMQPVDEQLLQYCLDLDFPIHIVLNKADRLSRHKQNQTLQTMRHSPLCRKLGDRLSIQLLSAQSRDGIEALQEAILPFIDQA